MNTRIRRVTAQLREKIFQRLFALSPVFSSVPSLLPFITSPLALGRNNTNKQTKSRLVPLVAAGPIQQQHTHISQDWE
jgi:hypothetical protein